MSGDMGATNREEEEDEDEDEDEGIWQEIERAERYLVSSMYEEAASVASGVMKKSKSGKVLECGGMVLLQSLHHSNILPLLSQQLPLPNSIIPLPLLLTGASLQMSHDGPSAVADFLQDYLAKLSTTCACDEYVEQVTELYVVNVLATALHDPPRAISYLGHATHLPQQLTQRLLTRLHSMPRPCTSRDVDKESAASMPPKQQQPLLKLSQRVQPCLWWFRTFLCNANLVLASLALLLFWTLRRKNISLKGMVERQAWNIKKAAAQLWQLVFSHHVNPLAAVQSPIRAPHR